MTLAPGIHTIAAADYHRDPAERPSLSASIAAVMCNRSPRHAYEAHPRLNPNYQPPPSDTKFDIGNVAHAALLEGLDICHPVDANDWRTKAAQEARDAAREAGLIPLLADQHQRVCTMVAAVQHQLANLDIDPPLFADGKPEQTLIWDEHGVTCRARLDWLRNDHRAIDDFKTAGQNAHPQAWTRYLFGAHKDLQAVMYPRAVHALTGHTPEFRFLVAEVDPPHAVSVISLAPSAVELAEQKLDWCLQTWRDCLKTGIWPAYPTRVAYAEAPAWSEMQWLELRGLDEQERAA